jgi:hemerythrin-like domain-containing protein
LKTKEDYEELLLETNKRNWSVGRKGQRDDNLGSYLDLLFEMAKSIMKPEHEVFPNAKRTLAQENKVFSKRNLETAEEYKERYKRERKYYEQK